MSANNRLIKRKSVWYYHRRVPKHLAPAFGKTIISRSLRTTSASEARKRRSVLDLEYDCQFDELEKNLVQPVMHGPDEAGSGKPMTREELEARLPDYIAEKAASWENRYIDDPAESVEQLREMRTNKEIELAVLSDPEEDNYHLAIHRAQQEIVGERPLEGLTDVAAGELVRRGLVEIVRKELAILSDEFDFRPSSARGRQTRTPSTVSFGDVATDYLNDVREKARANGHRAKWVEKVEAHVAFLVEFIGEETAIGAVDYDKARELQRNLARLPAIGTNVSPDWR